ncbi:MAG: hypothetical protein V7724_16000 [Sediminicola sp.]
MNSDLLVGLKTEVELTSLWEQLHSTAPEAMLQVGLDAHLGRPKNG